MNKREFNLIRPILPWIIYVMFGRCAKGLVVTALVLSLGAHWVFLQTIAWVGMAINYSQDASLTIALEKTFDGKHPCRICKVVEEGKQAEKKSEAKIEIKKLDCFIMANIQFFFPPFHHLPSSHQRELLPRIEAPPVPPPLLG